MSNDQNQDQVEEEEGEEVVEEAVILSRRRDDDEIDMTPMIDITFLLLIFFVVTSDMNPEKAAALPEAKNGITIALNNAALIQVRPGSSDTPEVVLGDGRVLSNDPDVQEIEIGDYLRFNFDQGKTTVVLQADGDLPTGQVGRVRRSMSEAMEDEMTTINIAVMEKP